MMKNHINIDNKLRAEFKKTRIKSKQYITEDKLTQESKLLIYDRHQKEYLNTRIRI